MKRFLLMMLLSLCCVISAEATTGEITEFFLDNGLKLVVKEDHRAPVAVSQIWYKVGSGDEKSGLTGISHLLEHFMFRGTKQYGPGQLKRILVDQGCQINAGTSTDYTVYYEIMPVEQLETVFKLEADRMRGLVFDESLFQKEKQVVIEERRLRTEDNPKALTYEQFAAVAYTTGPYHHSIVGWMADIQHLTTADLKQWYQNWYVPNNAVVVVVGDVDPSAVYKTVKHYFGRLKKQSLPLSAPEVKERFLGKRTIEVRLSSVTPWLLMGYHVPTLKTAESQQEAYALMLIAGLLDGGNSARLAKTLIRDQKIAVNVSASYPLYQRFDGLFMISGTPASDKTLDALESAFLDQITQLQTMLVIEKELTRVKNQFVSSHIYQKDEVAMQAEEIGLMEMIGLSWKEAEQFETRIEAITPEAIRAVAKKYLVKNRLTVGYLKPLKQQQVIERKSK